MRRLSISLCVLLLLVSGCATVRSDYDKPKIDVVGITNTPASSAILEFAIQLRITNPNAEPLELDGLFYELRLDGIDVVTGTARDLPPIAGYSSETVSVDSAAGLISSLRFASKVVESGGLTAIPYTLRVKLGTTSRWIPATTVTEEGLIDLR